MELYRKVPRLCTAWCAIEVMLYAGQIFGWSSLLYVLKQEGFYANVCNREFSRNVNISKIIPSHHVELNTEIIGHNASTAVNFSSYSFQTLTDLKNNTNNTADILYSISNTWTNKNDGKNMHNIYDFTSSANETNTDIDSHYAIDVDSVVSCSGQDSRLNLWFSIGAGFSYAMCAFLGPLMRKIGMRLYRLFFIVIYVIGALCLAFATPAIPWLICPGLCCIGIAGMGLYSTNLQISFLFIKIQSTITALMVGLFDFSTISQQLVKVAYEHHISLKYSYIILAILHVMLVGISTFVFFPVLRFGSSEVNVKGKTAPSDGKLREERIHFLDETLDETPKASLKTPTLSQTIFCSRYVLHLYWMCVKALRFVSFLGFMNSWLESLFPSENEKKSYYLGVFSYTTMGTVLTALTAGLLHDSQRWKYTGDTDYRSANMPIILPLILTTTLSLSCTALTYVPQEECLYITFILFTVFRSYLFSFEVTFINDSFPMIYFTELYGILQTVAGIGSMLQYGLFAWFKAYRLAPVHVTMFLLVIELSTLAHPVNLWYQCYKRRHDQRSPKNEGKTFEIKTTNNESISL